MHVGGYHCSRTYGLEQVGQGLKVGSQSSFLKSNSQFLLVFQASGIPREEVFITTKLNNSDHGIVEAALLSSLEKLNTPYIDLWLMHWARISSFLLFIVFLTFRYFSPHP